jgi:hypothetical protein
VKLLSLECWTCVVLAQKSLDDRVGVSMIAFYSLLL